MGIDELKRLLGLINEPTIWPLRGLFDNTGFVEVYPVLLNCVFVCGGDAERDWSGAER